MLKVSNLQTYFYNKPARRFIRAVDDVSFHLDRGEALGLIGESGSGKTVTARTIMGLIRGVPGVIAGTILFDDGEKGESNLLDGLWRSTKIQVERNKIIQVDKDNVAWLKTVDARMRPIRGKSMSMVFQEPTTALNPLMTVGQQLKEAIIKKGTPKSEATEQAEWWLNSVHLDNPKNRLAQYPWELSGGACQRVMIALALCTKPALLIADEPTTNLDATTQALIINLLEELTADDEPLSTLLITHDLGIVSRLANKVAVMYAGVTVEYGPKSEVLNPKKEPKHPYTAGLLNAAQTTQIPRPDLRSGASAESSGAMDGEVPSLEQIPYGCRFYERCSMRIPKCQEEEPELLEIEEGHYTRCWRCE